MHEAPIVRDLVRKVEAIARREGGPKVLGVKVRLGILCGLSADAFTEHFRHASSGTVAESARLIVEVNDNLHDPQAREVVLESLDVEDARRQTIRGRQRRPTGDPHHPRLAAVARREREGAP